MAMIVVNEWLFINHDYLMNGYSFTTKVWLVNSHSTTLLIEEPAIFQSARNVRRQRNHFTIVFFLL